MHNLCEQGLEPLKRTVAAVRPFLEAHKGKYQWLNLGGGHLVTRDDYDRTGLVDLQRELRASREPSGLSPNHAGWACW